MSLPEHVLDNLRRRALDTQTSAGYSASTRIPADVLLSLIAEVRAGRAAESQARRRFLSTLKGEGRHRREPALAPAPSVIPSAEQVEWDEMGYCHDCGRFVAHEAPDGLRYCWLHSDKTVRAEQPESLPASQHERELYVFVPWECPGCGKKAQARRDHVVRCVCGHRSPSTPGAII